MMAEQQVAASSSLQMELELLQIISMNHQRTPDGTSNTSVQTQVNERLQQLLTSQNEQNDLQSHLTQIEAGKREIAQLKQKKKDLKREIEDKKGAMETQCKDLQTMID